MSALFSSKGGKKAADIDFRLMRKEERATFFEFLRKLGWVEIDQPFEIDRNWSHNKIRRAAKDSAVQMDADLLVETEDEKFSGNPFNNYVYYIWRRTGDSLPLPPGFTVPPLQLMQQLVMHRETMKRSQQMAPPPMQPPMPPPGQPPMPPPAQPPAQPNPFMAGQQPGQPKPPQQPPQAAQQKPQQPPTGPAMPPGTATKAAQPQFGEAIPKGDLPAQGPPQQPKPPQQPPQAAPKPQAPAAPKPPAAAPPQQPQQPQPQQAPRPPQPAPQPQPATAPAPAPAQAQACPKCGGPMNVLPTGQRQCTKCGTVA